MTLKQKIHAYYLKVINEKVQLLQKVLADLKESGTNETKSTAGDKHETALAMLQIEQANTREHLEKIAAQKAVLEKIDPSISATTIVKGSLVKTSRGYLFVSTALGKAIIDGITVIALSPESPLGIKLMGLKAGDTCDLNNNRYCIETIE